MDILLVSNEDTCRSRIAQELLHAFGRGMNISTAGIMRGLRSRCRVQCDGTECFSVSRKKPSGVGTYTHRSWDYVITLCKEAGEELKFITLDAKQQVHFNFEDPFKNRFQNESEQEQQIAALYETMYRRLYEFYRDELSGSCYPIVRAVQTPIAVVNSEICVFFEAIS